MVNVTAGMASPSKNNETLERPQSSVGAPDLLSICKPSKHGFIRKEGQLERTFKFLKWRQRFVVLSRGCIYIYKDEYGSIPLKSASMKVFLKCARTPDARMRWAFHLQPENSTENKVISFACSSDDVRREWMMACREEIVKAKNVGDKEPTRTRNDNDYTFLEKEVRSPPPAPPVNQPTCSDSDMESVGSDGGGEYTTIDEARVASSPIQRGKKPAAPNPKSTKNGVSLKKPIIGKSKARPPTPRDSDSESSPRHTEISRKSFQYEGGDRDTVKDILTARPEGTYLVRKSRMDNREVLSVNIQGDLKEYKIYEHNGDFSINNENYYLTVEKLLSHYTDNPLPKKTAKLYRAYSLTDPGYINT